MELYEVTIIFFLGIIVSMTLAWLFNEQIQGLFGSLRTIPAFDRREFHDRRLAGDRRSHERGVNDRRQLNRRKTDR